MKGYPVLWVMSLASGALGLAAAPQAASLAGFKAAAAAAEMSREKAFDAALDPAEIRSWLETMSAEPNHVGSPHDKANADFMLENFRRWGWDAHIETFYVLYPTPKHLTLEMVAPSPYTARLSEPAVEGDPTAALQGSLPPYNVFCRDGDVTAEVVYVNYGMPDDYAGLLRHGVDPAGKIVIARYGHGWRGLKVKLAQEHGAVGCIIYSDPRDDGYWNGDTYPKGTSRPEFGVQRGAIGDILLYTGDALTPGVAATKDAKRIDLKDAPTLMSIPALPISYGDARPILAALEGPVAPEAWRGALPITYHLGPGPAKVRLAVSSNWEIKPVYDVIAMLRGSDHPDQWVIRGNHHDGWVNGAWDPLSANVALMAEAKAFGVLSKSGWRPRRTLIYASWDGEEAGLLGSTEWTEAHAEELQRKAVLYINSDENGRGFLFAGGSLSLQHLVTEVAAAVPDPEAGVSVLERRRARIRADAYEGDSSGADADLGLKAAEQRTELPMNPLGAGSDYTAFVQHLGIASVNLIYGDEDFEEGIYHSAYDTFSHYQRFGDPKFQYGVTLAMTSGRIAMRAADADVLPLAFSGLAAAVARNSKEIQSTLASERDRAAKTNRLLDEGVFKLAADPTVVLLPPQRAPEVPAIDFSALDAAAARLSASAAAYDQALARAADLDYRIGDSQIDRVNQLLQGLEQTLLSPKGMPGRPWYRHMVFAPGLFSGYGSKTLPAVREAVEAGHWSEANAYIPIVAGVLEAAARRLDEAAGALAPHLGRPSAGPKAGAGEAPPPDS